MLITGANGMLGKSLSKLFPKATLLKGKANLDLTNIEETNNYLEGKHFDVIIHCAAFTDLNYCDNNPIKSRILHSEIVDHLCKYCNKLIYISTNPTDAQRIYYLTKQEGEKRTMLNNSSNIVLRTNIYGKGGLADWAISELKNKKQIKGFFNVLFNAIHVDQLSNIIKDILLDEFSGGVMDIAGNYTISKYDFICLIANYLNLDLNLISKSKSLIPQNLVIDTSENISLNEGLKLLKKDYE
tara:strand:- start:26 stop:748 length:723 start_codon:yes stop_codon:yes gene_type:complete